MEMEFEPHKIRQVLFSFENKSDFYRYDVCQSIRISELKRMLETALQIPRQRIHLFQNNVDYTQTDDSRLDSLFPYLDTIDFKVTLSSEHIADSFFDKEIALKLRLDAYCDKHLYKYPNHFCFDCFKSFCSMCNIDDVHAEHETIEKYDYLLNSKVIVGRIFRKISEEVKSLKFENEGYVQNFSAELTNEFFDKLRNLITEIELRIKKILSVYLESSKNSLKQIEENLNTLKENCAEALEERKTQLHLENMLLDESVIVNYYNTILQIYSQKQPIEQDKFRFSELIGSLSIVKPVAEGLFNEIKEYLIQKLNLDAFSKCEKEILKNKINPIDKDYVRESVKQDVLLKGMDANKFVFVIGDKQQRKRMHSLAMAFRPDAADRDFIGKENKEALSISEEKGFKEVMQENVAGFISEQIENVEETGVKNINQVEGENAEGDLEIVNKSNRKTETKIKEPFEPTSGAMEIEESIWVKIDNESYVFTLQPGTKSIYTYSEQRQKVKKLTPKFPSLKSEAYFLPGCAWVNAAGKLYISGGFAANGSISNEFLVYENSDKNHLILLKALHEERSNHSMFYYDKHIYIVGGEAAKTSEVFDIYANKLISKENLNYESVDEPILWVHGEFIYSFFGKKSGNWVDFVQRANLKVGLGSDKAFKWEKVVFKKNVDVTVKISNAGVISCGENEIYFFGGKGERGITNQSIVYNFDTSEFSNACVPLEDGQFFKDTKFIELADQTYGQFSLTEADNFLKINVSYA